MPLIFFGEKMIPLYSTDQIRKADEFAVKKLGIPSLLLMENAARSLFAIIMNNYPDLNPLDKIGIVCGKGNNGGDGFALARNFMNMGFSVSVIALCPKSELAGDALTNHNILVNLLKYNQDSSFSYYKNLSDLNKLKNCSVIIDAILGTGIKGEIKGKFEKVIDKLNDMEGIKIAIDVPSGLDMNTSTGSTIFFSDLTITLAKQKTELVYGMGFVHSGEVAVGSIGIGSEYFDSLEVDDYLIEPEDVYGVLKLKELDVHKYSSGKVFVIAGSYHYTGAAVLTAEAALKNGAGSVVLAVPESIKPVVSLKLREVVVESYGSANDEFLNASHFNELKERTKWADIIVIGPGLGKNSETVKCVHKLLNAAKNKTIIIDADGLNELNLSGIKLKNLILTPHHKEFADLLAISVGELENNLMKISKDFASKHLCYLALKGAPTIIFTPSGEALINSTGNPGMAKFGTGDVLTGTIAAMITNTIEIEDGIISAVYLHSLAADILAEKNTEFGFTATEIMDTIPYAIQFIGQSIL